MEAKRVRGAAHVAVQRLYADWQSRAIAAGVSEDQAHRELARAVAMRFPGVVVVSLVAGFMLGWFIHG